MSEHSIALLLALLHRMPDALDFQRAGHWAREEITPRLGCLNGMRACVVGYGPIGQEIVRKLAAFDVKTVVVSRATGSAKDVERFFPREELHAALAQSDIVVAATNPDAQTLGVFDARAFAAMRRGSFFINIARGSLVDSQALMEALRSGHIAGAGLDVTHHEPMPAGDPLWSAPNIVITPHIAGAGSTGIPEQIALLGRIVDALKSGAALPNLVRAAS